MYAVFLAEGRSMVKV
jgi:hypothetical protein